MRTLGLLILSMVFLCAADMMRDRSKGIVIDTANKLMWQDSEDNINVKKSQAGAQEYCENLIHADYSDWRVPSMEEFESIVDKKNEKTYINRAFKYNRPDGYWSDNVKWRTLWFYADYMHFLSGTPYYDNKKKLKYVRCVRNYE